jgi:predicted TIM-barrel fold metal-dependent hydrolase
MTRRILLAAALLLPLSVYLHGGRARRAGAAAPTLAELKAIPKVDVHSHYEHDDSALVPTLEEWKLRSVLVNVLSDGRLVAKGEKMRALRAAHPERFFLITTFDPAPIDDPDFAARTIARLRGEIARGAKGVKVWKTIGMEVKDARGSYVQIDDPRYQPIWDFLAERKIPVLAHIGEPRAAWLPLDPASPHYWYYSHHPEYHAYAHPEVPRWETIIAARDRWVARNPKLTIVAAHLASLERDTDEVAKRLDAYPNLYIDTAARFNDLAMQPSAKVRDFMIRYQDRVLYGTDFGEGDFSRSRLENGYAQHWSYLAGADSVDFGQPSAWHARVPGLALPRPVLEKIAHLNAERVLGLPAAGEAGR